ncbi:Aspartic peptidase domain containing protein [Abeliophyllum distichum]|uniref:Aspartic peptidase domain containing protein n=1 Tax=Abeliophyllum distichum TaxID=126358 RepID=A0ABD1RDH4_9LAMI
MPSYAKFMKEILSNKRKLEEHKTVMLTEECSAILQNKLPPKLKDPGSFNIPCTIGSLFFYKALCDLGASVNLMPYSIFKQLGLGEVKPTTVTLQLADRSIKRPRGIVEDILVDVDKFIFPADFIILDMCEDKDVPLILGRSFLATGRAVIDVQKGKLMLKVNDEHITFNVFKAIKFSSSPDSCFEIDATDQKKINTSTLKNQSDQKEHIPINKPMIEEQLSDEENETFIVEFEQSGKTQSYQYDKRKLKLWKVNKNGCNDNRSKQIKSSKDLFKVS